MSMRLVFAAVILFFATLHVIAVQRLGNISREDAPSASVRMPDGD